MSTAKNIAQIVVNKNTIENNFEDNKKWQISNINFSNIENIEKYYESYYGLFNTQYWDIRINSKFDNSFKFEKEGAYYISFEVEQSADYAQSFNLYARDTAEIADNSNYLFIDKFTIPVGVEATFCEAVFVPTQKILNPVDYLSLVFKVDRIETYPVIMKIKNLTIKKLNNLLKQDSQNVQAASATFETLQVGECRFIINDDLFYIGNDKILEIPEEMNVVINNINIVDFTGNTLGNTDIACLINYKYWG